MRRSKRTPEELHALYQAVEDDIQSGKTTKDALLNHGVWSAGFQKWRKHQEPKIISLPRAYNKSKTTKQKPQVNVPKLVELLVEVSRWL